jgi:hypothetical protein
MGLFLKNPGKSSISPTLGIREGDSGGFVNWLELKK